jgi:uncharacterized membrane protein YdjX (TVP38/TMEM64 family)
MNTNSKMDVFCYALGKTLVDFACFLLGLVLIGMIPGTIIYFAVDKPELTYLMSLQAGTFLAVVIIIVWFVLSIIYDGLKYVFKRLKKAVDILMNR